VQLVEKASPKLVCCVRFRRRLENRYLLPVHPCALSVNGWAEQDNGLRAVLPLTRHQCRIHCEGSRVAHGASRRRCTPQATRNTPKEIQKRVSTKLKLCGICSIVFKKKVLCLCIWRYCNTEHVAVQTHKK